MVRLYDPAQARQLAHRALDRLLATCAAQSAPAAPPLTIA